MILYIIVQHFEMKVKEACKSVVDITYTAPPINTEGEIGTLGSTLCVKGVVIYLAEELSLLLVLQMMGGAREALCTGN